MNHVSLDRISFATFESAVKSRFRVILDREHAMDLELSEATPLRSSESAQHENFSLVFTGPRDVPLPQRIYRLEHKQIGVFDLFLVPIARDSDGTKYEAVFNRKRPDTSRAANG